MKKLLLIVSLLFVPVTPAAAEPVCFMDMSSGRRIDLTGLCSGSGVTPMVSGGAANPDAWEFIAGDLDGNRYLGNKNNVHHFRRVTRNGISRVEFDVRVLRPNGSRRRTMRISAFCNEGVIRTGRNATQADDIPTEGTIGESLLGWACS